MSEKNKKNLSKYHWLSFIYDAAVGNSLFNRARQREFELAKIQPSQRVLIVGMGTGLDLPYIPLDAEVVGIDLSSDMLSQARLKAINRNASFYEMNAEELSFEERSFDIVILNLILSVVGNPRKTMTEVYRVIKPAGSIWVLGKFTEQRIGFLRKTLSFVTSALGGANLNLSLNELIRELPLIKVYEEKRFMTDIIGLKVSGNRSSG
ncbi:MAG TPA: methyltransferase domain-containing protein [Anaerolineales bacterium]|nr:methyltransferase domain-containing protein [Anaerolineales bacterium]